MSFERDAQARELLATIAYDHADDPENVKESVRILAAALDAAERQGREPLEKRLDWFERDVGVEGDYVEGRNPEVYLEALERGWARMRARIVELESRCYGLGVEPKLEQRRGEYISKLRALADRLDVLHHAERQPDLAPLLGVAHEYISKLRARANEAEGRESKRQEIERACLREYDDPEEGGRYYYCDLCEATIIGADGTPKPHEADCPLRIRVED
jgi:hypothetical protein